VFAGEAERLKTAHAIAGWSVWHVAALMRARKLPSLDKLMPTRRRRRFRQTGWQHQLRMVELINAALGGTPRAHRQVASSTPAGGNAPE
jgi:hypothetical protein